MSLTLPQSAEGRGISQSSRRAFRNPWVLGMLGIVVVFLSVNAVMISLAYAFKPELIDKDFYRKGRDIEQTIETRRAAWEALGWDARFALPEAAAAGRTETWRFLILDRSGEPVTGARIHLLAQRPVGGVEDFGVPMTEALPGEYVAHVAMPLAGHWDLVAEIVHDGHTYSKAQRVIVGDPPGR